MEVKYIDGIGIVWIFRVSDQPLIIRALSVDSVYGNDNGIRIFMRNTVIHDIGITFDEFMAALDKYGEEIENER